ncbi:hypothetical protein Zmor_023307 [Zophobas morio]|uniref:Chitin-binding type-2 domain-containing protein n=1 Tax=Zophobas morio TaxID=2755281 RepID=A0AA38M6V8_9CUCU|nr:hypothetical protein Zmor_023307 [Zophobas morio]
MKLVTFISFTILTCCTSEKLIDYRIPLASSCTPRECISPGPLCETCSSLVACVELANGTYGKHQLATCNSPTHCVHEVCTSDYDPFCAGATELSFPCNQVGSFPDPFYHNRFVLCVDDDSDLKAYSNVCEDGFSFNLANDLCSEVMAHAECPQEPYPVPICHILGQSGALEQKPAMYYICKERTYDSNKSALYPYLYLCPGGQEYKDFMCTSYNLQEKS